MPSSVVARILAALLLFVSLTIASARADTAERRLASAGLLADVDVLERAYTELHPGLYRYNTPDRMARHFDALRHEFRSDRTLAEAYLAFSVFAAKIRCGHTYANFYNQPESIAQALFKATNRVPFQFRWLHGRMVVTRNLSTETSLVPGTEVLSIAGVPARRILARLMTIARADGGNDAKRVASLEVRGDDRYEAFDIFLPLFFREVGARQELIVRAPTDRLPRRVTVDALSHEQRLATRTAPIADDAAAFSLDIRADGVAVLDMPGWALYDSAWDWRGFLEQTFASLNARAPRALIIDVRRNEGGLSVGDELLAHLGATAITLPKLERRVRYRSTPEALRPYLTTWDRSFHDWGDAAKPLGGGYFRLLREGENAEGDVIEAKSPRYRGRVYVLVGATNSSATFEFANAIRGSGLGTLVGQTTGGNRRGINGGAFFFLRLPNSTIELDLPLVGQFPLDPQPDAGIEPDIAVRVTRADVANGRDVELDAALADLAHR